MDRIDMPPGWECGQRNLTTVGHALVWTYVSNARARVLRIQFDVHQGGYLFGVVSSPGRPKAHDLTVDPYTFSPIAPIAFDTPQAAAVWAAVEDLV